MSDDEDLERRYGRAYDTSRLRATTLDLYDVLTLLLVWDYELLADDEIRNLGRRVCAFNAEVSRLNPKLKERAEALRSLRTELDRWETRGERESQRLGEVAPPGSAGEVAGNPGAGETPRAGDEEVEP